MTPTEAVIGETRLLIDGELRPARSGRTYENVNPATEEVIGVAADASPEDMDDAIGAARRAFVQVAHRGRVVVCKRRLVVDPGVRGVVVQREFQVRHLAGDLGR